MNIDGKPGTPKSVIIVERGRHISYSWDEYCTVITRIYERGEHSSLTGINELEIYLELPFEGKYKTKFFYRSFAVCI